LDSVANTPKAVTTNTVVAYNFSETALPFSSAASAVRRPSPPLEHLPSWTINTPSGLAGDYALQFATGQHVEVANPNNAVQLDTNNPSFYHAGLGKFKGKPAAREVFYYNNGPGARCPSR